MGAGAVNDALDDTDELEECRVGEVDPRRCVVGRGGGGNSFAGGACLSKESCLVNGAPAYQDERLLASVAPPRLLRLGGPMPTFGSKRDSRRGVPMGFGEEPRFRAEDALS